MTQQRYIDYEEDFLEAMATRFGFFGKNRFVFVTRFREQYAELKDSSFAGEWGDVLLEDIQDSHRSDPAIILRDRLKVICDRIESAGCDFNGTQRGKWKVAKCWLREEIFPQWLQENTPATSLEQCWQQLWDLAQLATEKQIKPAIVSSRSSDNLDLRWNQETAEYTPVPLGSWIRYQVGFQGYLLLLERFTSGEIWCLSPSFLAPMWPFAGDETTIPDEKAQVSALEVTGSPGWENVVVAIAPSPLKWDWLPRLEDQPLQLRGEHLRELLDFARNDNSFEWFKIKYELILPLQLQTQ